MFETGSRAILAGGILMIGILLCGAQPLKAQSAAPNSLGFIPATINEIDMAFPLHNKWHLSTQADVQLVTQGTYTVKNPWADVQRFTVRPWVIYNGFKNMKIWVGYTQMKKYAIPEMGNYETTERRLTVMGTFAQKLPKGSMFQQVRYEQKWFDDKTGKLVTYPRLRVRFGVNHFLHQQAEHPAFVAPNISYYFELMLKFAPASYAKDHFDIYRQMVYYSAGLSQRVFFMAGMLAQLQLRSNGTQFDIYYGPMILFKYNHVRKKRETFDNVDGGQD
jgi:hypothetical protein